MSNSQKFAVLNRYYRITKFYDFIKSISINAGIIIGLLVVIFMVLDFYILDTEAILNSLITNFSTWFVLSVFLVSETVLGLIPPEIFIAWSTKAANPWFYLFILASLSYVGGIFSYYIGKSLYLVPAVKNYVESKISTHIKNLQKWGGLLVFVGAMLPLPHSLVSMACGLIKYEIKHYLLWALFRFVRFFIYALIVYKLV